VLPLRVPQNLHVVPEHMLGYLMKSKKIALPILNLGARWGSVANATPRPLYPPRGRCGRV